MSHPSKQKGNRVERLIVDLAKKHGLDAVRAWGSNGKALGFTEDVDARIANRSMQIKARKSIADYIKPAVHIDAQIIKEDRQEPLAVIRVSDYFEMLAKLQELE